MHNDMGVIDLGSNTARLVIYQQDAQGLVYELDNIKRGLRLSSHLQDGRLDPAGWEKTMACMRQFRDILAAHQVSKVIGVATAAVRQAENGGELIKSIEAETGITMRVLSGEEEARYGYLAVMHTMNLSEGITVDIGGGSTELTYFADRKLQHCVSFPFGIVTLTRLFLHQDPPAPGEVTSLRDFLITQFQTCDWLRDKACPVIAIGGTARNLAKMHQRSTGYSLGSLHHYQLSADTVQNILAATLSLPLEERKQLPGLSKDRADVILSGLSVFDTLLTLSGGKELIVSNKGLRDGVLYEAVWGPALPPDATAVRKRSIEQFMQRYRIDKKHAEHVRDLALSLFDQLVDGGILPYSDAERDFLEAAALLHDAGRSINVYEVSEHTFYLLSNVLLWGYTHRQRLLIAMIASYKNNKLLLQQVATHADILSKSDKGTAEKLGMLVQLARSLDRTMMQQIKQVQLEIGEKETLLHCYGTKPSLIEYDLLEETVQKAAKAWKKPVRVFVHSSLTHS
ncbi:Ppx/GppA family phosphatase [Brevibacillus ruminantium]|uniref:Ppx/GppA family phosphatase n=1 Tax=Brevibacillus ruminantium TaxID=2950604 RepID=A0ABY4WC96_9BACL|nr:Ppx/GppA phosphatase family protein [Brevibacillus ruminantium]USG64683.1 Ppx/GppA family phosphatase [Brevibacillus ruminantium]